MPQEDFSSYLAAIVESSDDAIISKDLNGIIRTFNAAAERMFGYRSDEIVGKSVRQLIPPERHTEEDMILGRLRRGERIDHYETIRVTRDGRRLDVSLTVSPVRGASGEIVGASKIVRDITESKRTAAALAEQEEWFRVTLRSIADAVIASDPTGAVTFLNPEAERLTGWPLAEAAGRPLADVFRLVHEETRAPLDNPAAQVLQLGRSVGLSNHSMLVGRNGDEWPVADSAAPIVNQEGHVIGVVLVFREISQARKAEARNRADAAERERLLQSERAARSEAERANRIKDDFVAMVSHELRTPLNTILGWTELLRVNQDNPGTLGHGLDVIARSTRLQTQLISDLLDISRIVAGKLHLELEEADLGEIVRNSVDSLRSDASAKGLSLVSDVCAGATPTIGDPARLQQIVLNLVSNAIKFTSRGGGITVRLRQSDDQAEITVTDSGVGIRPDLVPDLFQRFRQGAPMTTRRHGGLGLGLSIAKHLTELHGGSIRAWSAGEGRGSTFTVELPLSSAELAQALVARTEEHRDAAGHAHAISLHGVKVLVVDDDANTRDLVRRLLESHRAVVAVAASAPEALELATSDRPHLIVSDVGLPHVDGYELIRRLRQRSDGLAAIPAVALTAFARHEDRTRALRAGFNAFVAKPVEPSELVITLSNFARLLGLGQRR
jgi:PAS domain S-box-containing protein